MPIKTYTWEEMAKVPGVYKKSDRCNFPYFISNGSGPAVRLEICGQEGEMDIRIGRNLISDQSDRFVKINVWNWP